MNASKAAKRIGKRVLIISLAVVFVFAGMLGALALVSNPVISAKQSQTSITASFTKSAADANQAVVTFRAGFKPEVFRDIEREMRITVTATDCVLAAGESAYEWTNGSGAKAAGRFAVNGTGLQSAAITQGDFYISSAPYDIPFDDNAVKYITGSIGVRITGANPTVTVALEDKEYRTGFNSPITLTGYGTKYDVSRKSLDATYWLYTFSSGSDEFLGLAIDKTNNEINSICALGNDNGDPPTQYAVLVPGNDIPLIIRCIITQLNGNGNPETILGIKTSKSSIADLVIGDITGSTVTPLTGSDLASLMRAYEFVADGGLNMLTITNFLTVAFSWGPGDNYLQLSPEALLDMCTVKRSAAVVRLITPPPTGDATPLTALLALSAVSMAGLLLLSRRTRKPARR